MVDFESFMRTVAVAGSVLFALLLLARAGWAWRTRHDRAGLAALPPGQRLLRVARMLALGLFAIGALALLFVLQRGTLFMPLPWQATLALLLLAWLLLEMALSAWPRHPGNRWLGGLGHLACLLAGAIGLLLVIGAVAAFRYPPPGDSVVLARVPFEGVWVAAGAGASAATNHHDRIASQKYAADLAALCADGRLFRGAGTRQEDSCTFGAPVLSPVDGVVVRAVDGHADGGSREVLPGNHVVIRFGEGQYVALAHFRSGSLRVQVDEPVRAGQPVAEAGNSGNSDFPHLHIHVQATADYDLRHGKALPWRFARMERRRFLWWSQVENGFLLANDQVRPAR